MTHIFSLKINRIYVQITLNDQTKIDLIQLQSIPFENQPLNQIAMQPIEKKIACLIEQSLTAKSPPKNILSDLNISHLNAFAKDVITALLLIPKGTTLTYAQLAKNASHPKACQAVGQVLAKNRFPILIPCHRVISANGSLGGFSAGLLIKKQLLEIENYCPSSAARATESENIVSTIIRARERISSK